MHRRSYSTLVLALAAVLCLTACAPGTDTDADATASPSTSAEPTATSPSTTPSEPESGPSESSSATPQPSEDPDGSADDGQSIEAACGAVSDVVHDAATGLAELDPSQPEEAAATLSSLGESISAAASQVSNADVAAQLPGLVDGFESASAILTEVAGGDFARFPELQEVIFSAQESFATFTELCSAD